VSARCQESKCFVHDGETCALGHASPSDCPAFALGGRRMELTMDGDKRARGDLTSKCCRCKKPATYASEWHDHPCRTPERSLLTLMDGAPSIFGLCDDCRAWIDSRCDESGVMTLPALPGDECLCHPPWKVTVRILPSVVP